VTNPRALRRPILFVAILVVAIVVVLLVSGAIGSRLKLPEIAIVIIGDGVLALLALVLLIQLHWWREVGLRPPAPPHLLGYFVVPCVPVILNGLALAVSGIAQPRFAAILLFLGTALLVGFVEETYFRGMILRALLSRGPWPAVLISSVLFGFLHLLNVISGANLAATFVQVAYALGIGMMFAAAALRTGTILPLIVIHAATDFLGFLALNSPLVTTKPSPVAVAVTLIEVLIYAGYSILVMRQVQRTPPRAPGASSGADLR
jgi:membrane protease YdiL (CAAX protease family)